LLEKQKEKEMPSNVHKNSISYKAVGLQADVQK
jgi:hypothetical protein